MRLVLNPSNGLALLRLLHKNLVFVEFLGIFTRNRRKKGLSFRVSDKFGR